MATAFLFQNGHNHLSWSSSFQKANPLCWLLRNLSMGVIPKPEELESPSLIKGPRFRWAFTQCSSTLDFSAWRQMILPQVKWNRRKGIMGNVRPREGWLRQETPLDQLLAGFTSQRKAALGAQPLSLGAEGTGLSLCQEAVDFSFFFHSN